MSKPINIRAEAEKTAHCDLCYRRILALCLRVREEDAQRGFDAVKAVEESEHQYSTIQKAAQVAASIRSQGEP